MEADPRSTGPIDLDDNVTNTEIKFNTANFKYQDYGCSLEA